MMLSAKKVQNICPQCRFQLLRAFEGANGLDVARKQLPRRRHQLLASTNLRPANSSFHPQQIRSFSSTKKYLQDSQPKDEPLAEPQPSPDEIETVVRQARKTFGDTLPEGYLSEEEYNLYERLYGAPIRLTRPEDVGIPFPDTQGNELEEHEDKATLLRETEDGTLEEVEYTLDPAVVAEEGQEGSDELHVDPVPLATDSQVEYIQAVANNEREYDALIKLQQDFEAAALRELREAEAREEEEEPEEEQEEHEEEEEEEEDEDEGEPGAVFDTQAVPRLHPLSVAGQFATRPSTVRLPLETFVAPITELLTRTHPKHLKTAAEEKFGGPMLPNSPATPVGKKNVKQVGVAMQAGHSKVNPIEADVYLAAVMPGIYASAMGCLTEVRRRLGPAWIQGLLAKNDGKGPRVLDIGGAGAAMSAWNDVVQAEWDGLVEEGKAHGEMPGKKSDKVVVVGSDLIRNRVKTFLDDTTFIPRVPDYLHSAENVDRLMDASAQPHTRKRYDVIICSHMLLAQEKLYKRREVIDNLWAQLEPNGGVLLVLEKGHPRGFEAVADVRQRLINRINPPSSTFAPVDEIQPTEAEDPEPLREDGMIIAPCTNHGKCPMYLIPGVAPGRKDFCHFNQRFTRPKFLQNMVGKGHTNHEDIQFSYVAVRRGGPANALERQNVQQSVQSADQAFKGYEGAEDLPNTLSLPRTLLPPLKRHKHVIIDVCTPAAKIERWTVSKAFSRQAYHDARKAKWGDLWALGAKTRVPRNVRLGRGIDASQSTLDDGGVRAQKVAKSGARSKPNVIDITQGVYGDLSAKERGRGKFAERRTKGGRLPKTRDGLMNEIMEEMDDVSEELEQDYKEEERKEKLDKW